MSSISRVLATGKNLYLNIPYSFPLISWPRKFIVAFFNFFQVDEWALNSKNNAADTFLTIHYCGKKENKNYIARLAYGDDFQEKHQGKKWLWQVSGSLWLKNPNYDLTILEVPKICRSLIHESKTVFIPQWITAEANVPSDISEFTRKDNTLANNLRKIRNNHLSYEVAPCSTALQEFYYTMYLPYIQQTHGNRAFILSYTEIKNKFGKGNLLFVKKDSEKIAGYLFLQEKQKGQLIFLGIKNGSQEYVREGAIGALYHFLFSYLREQHCRTVNMGTTRAFLNDGVLVSKRKWNPGISGLSSKGFLLSIPSLTEGSKAFLSNNPFILTDKTGAKGAVFVESCQSLTEHELNKLYNRYYLNGLTNFYVYSFSDIHPGIKENLPPHLAERITFTSVRDLL